MTRQNRFSQEVREWAVRMFSENGDSYGSEWEAIRSIAEKKVSAYFAQAELDRRPK